MPKFKVNKEIVATGNQEGENLYCVTIKGRYGWFGEGDSVCLIQANGMDEAARYASAARVFHTADHVPVSDERYTITLIASLAPTSNNPKTWEDVHLPNNPNCTCPNCS